MSNPAPITESPEPIWSAEVSQHTAQLLGPEGAQQLARMRSNLQVRQLAMRSILALGGLFVIVQAIIMPTTVGTFPREFVAFGWTVLVLCVIGVFTGLTLTLREILIAALFGFFAAPVLTLLVVEPVGWVMPPNLRIFTVVPLVEEAFKAIPALLLALSIRRDPRGSRTLYDFVIIGFVSGAGFTMHEDILWNRVAIADGPMQFLLPWVYNAGPYLSGWHAAWSTLVAVAIGAIILIPRRKVIRILAICVFALAVIEHSSWTFPWFDLLGMLGNGRVGLLIFIVVVGAAAIHGVWVQRWGRRRDELFPVAPPFFLSEWRTWPRKFGYRRLLTQAHSSWMSHRLHGASTIPGVLGVERLVLSAVDSGALSPSSSDHDSVTEHTG